MVELWDINDNIYAWKGKEVIHMNDRQFDLLMVIVGAIVAKAIDELYELAKKEVERRKDSDSKEKES